MSLLCSACLELHPPDNITNITDDLACHDCIRSLFKQAMESEGNYPPRWGRQKLKLNDFDHKILPQELRERYKEREAEYHTPPDFRIYCSYARPDVTADIGDERAACGAFVGRIPADWRDKLAHEADTIVKPRTRCNTCNTSYCMLCGMKSFHLTCINPGPREDHSAFEGLELGKDYQICPSKKCRRKVELRDGCNRVSCVCGQSLCFVCGKAARERHFRTAREDGGCPRWGHPDRQSAIWQTDVDDLWATDDREMSRHAAQWMILVTIILRWDTNVLLAHLPELRGAVEVMRQLARAIAEDRAGTGGSARSRRAFQRLIGAAREVQDWLDLHTHSLQRSYQPQRHARPLQDTAAHAFGNPSHPDNAVGFEVSRTGSIESALASEHDDESGLDTLRDARSDSMDPGWAPRTARLRQIGNNREESLADTNTTAVGYTDTPRGARIRNRVGHQTRLQASSNRLAALARIIENRNRLEPPIDRGYFDPLEAARHPRHVSDPTQATAGAGRSMNNAVSVGTRTINHSMPAWRGPLQEPRRDARPLTQPVSPIEAELATDQFGYGAFRLQGSQNGIPPMPRLRNDRLMPTDAQLQNDIARSGMFTRNEFRRSTGVAAQPSANVDRNRPADEGAGNRVRFTSTIDTTSPQPAAVHGDNASAQLDGVSRETNANSSL